MPDVNWPKMKLDGEMKEFFAEKLRMIKKYHVVSFEVEQIKDFVKNLLQRNCNRKLMALNSNKIKFKHVLIEEELIMFLDDNLIKKHMATFSAPDEVDARVLRF